MNRIKKNKAVFFHRCVCLNENIIFPNCPICQKELSPVCIDNANEHKDLIEKSKKGKLFFMEIPEKNEAYVLMCSHCIPPHEEKIT